MNRIPRVIYLLFSSPIDLTVLIFRKETIPALYCQEQIQRIGAFIGSYKIPILIATNMPIVSLLLTTIGLIIPHGSNANRMSIAPEKATHNVSGVIPKLAIEFITYQMQKYCSFGQLCLSNIFLLSTYTRAFVQASTGPIG